MTMPRNNNHAGVYGHLEYNGFFTMTLTNPNPGGKQGQVQETKLADFKWQRREGSGFQATVVDDVNWEKEHIDRMWKEV